MCVREQRNLPSFLLHAGIGRWCTPAEGMGRWMEGEARWFVVVVLVSAGCAGDPSTAIVWLGPSISSEHMPWVQRSI